MIEGERNIQRKREKENVGREGVRERERERNESFKRSDVNI